MKNKQDKEIDNFQVLMTNLNGQFDNALYHKRWDKAMLIMEERLAVVRQAIGDKSHKQ